MSSSKQIAGVLMKDQNANFFDSVIDPATGLTYSRRGVNLVQASTGDTADPTAVLYGPDGNVLWAAAAAMADGETNATLMPRVGVRNQLFNGNTWDRQEGVLSATALVSAARTVLTETASITNLNHRGLLVTLAITVASGTGGLLMRVYGADNGAVFLAPAPTGITATGTFGYLYYPGVALAAVAGNNQLNQVNSVVLPKLFRIRVDVSDASSYTYAVSYSLIL